MALILLENNMASVKGSCGGIYYHKDKSGLHIAKKPRTINQRTPKQDIQRRAFTAARAFSKVNRTVSYNIYLALNNLPLREPPITYPPIK